MRMSRYLSRAPKPLPKKGGKIKWDPVVKLSINLPGGQSFQTELVWDLRRPERSDKPAADGAPSAARAETQNAARDPDIVAFELAKALSLDAVEMLRIASDIRGQLQDMQKRPLQLPRRLREDRKANPVTSKPMKGKKLQSHAIVAAPGGARAPQSVPKKRRLSSTSETVLELQPHPRVTEALPVKKEKKRKEARIASPEGKTRKVEEPAKHISVSANPGDGETLRMKDDLLEELMFRCALCNVPLKGR